ncbi:MULTISPECIES: hypothetical protein [Yersinia pseudotuberculosis complex]|uniref:hypothetical protein n=1 Tax=Yersinia pseudotuberculosis complex TaxID=1649845 RepID=UPI000424DD80|nr:hypothetical protein [Yersinia wautersii]
MAKGKIKAGKIPAIDNKIVAGTPNAPKATLSFSFQYIDPTHAKFGFAAQEAGYFCKVLERLKGISSLTSLEFTTNRNAALKSHCIEWQTTSEPDGFSHLNEQFQSYTPYQFAVSRNEHGRIHGFFIGNVFHVVWLDPAHQLYPGK